MVETDRLKQTDIGNNRTHLTLAMQTKMFSYTDMQTNLNHTVTS